MKNTKIDYILEHRNTASQTAFFSVVPKREIPLETGLELIQQRPMDEFLHRSLLNTISALTPDRKKAVLEKMAQSKSPVFKALMLELVITAEGPGKALQHFSKQEFDDLKAFSPLVVIRSADENNRRLHQQWISLFRENIFFHTPLPAPEETGLPLICEGECRRPQDNRIAVSEIRKARPDDAKSVTKTSFEQTANKAVEMLEKAGISMEMEMRHQQSLSPFSLLRKWHFHTDVSNRRNRFSLTGQQTSFGKGLTLEAARASLSMEIVERCSAFPSVRADTIQGYRQAFELIRASFSDLESQAAAVLNPAELSLEVRYNDEPLYWVRGETADIGTGRAAMIPAQLLFLFCNLDEISLFSGLGSTGLASGNTLEEAKTAALLEVIERHQAATTPFDISSCFRLVSGDERIAPLLETYRSLGIDLQFRDLTSAMGIPCCQCFVTEQTGTIQKGTAAHLDARKAIISAICETTYPFPEGPPSRQGMADLTVVPFENLPDYTTSDPASDLALLEKVLLQNNFQPFYVDLTREDIGIPVVKAVIPGMEMVGDFDAFSRVHPALYDNYLTLFSHNGSR